MAGCILAVDDSRLTLKLISSMLSAAGYEVTTAQSGPEALSLVEDVRPDLIILDVMMPEMDGYEVCRELRRMPLTADVPVLMLTALDSLENKIKGFEAGADDYMLKPFQQTELAARVEALLRRSAKSPGSVAGLNAKIIAVFSLKGGVGVSTLAANLTVALAQIWDVPTVLVDLALTAGQAALMLNLSLRHTWADLAQVPIEQMDAALVDDVLLEHASGARVLAAPRRPEESDIVTATRIAETIALLSQSYHYLVLDLPHDLQDKSLAGLDAAHEILSVMAPDIASVRAMALALSVFRMLEYPADKTRLVLNNTFAEPSARLGKTYSLACQDIEATLQRSIDMEIPFAPEMFVPAVNAGVPPVFDAPNSPIGALLEDYAFHLSKEEQREQQPVSPSAAWQRVARRQQKRQRKW